MYPMEHGPGAAIDDALVLEAWQHGIGVERPQRELAVLSALTGTPVEQLARVSVGRRDAAILRARAKLFGPRLECETACPTCGARLELTLDANELLAQGDDRDIGETCLDVDGWWVTLRPADTTDMAAALASPDGSMALLRRCSSAVDVEGNRITGDDLPSAVRDTIIERMAELDPNAEIGLDLTCPGCDSSWQAAFDPPTFVLAELDAHAARLVAEVDVLARTYGWRESDVLAISPVRRRQYVELALQ